MSILGRGTSILNIFPYLDKLPGYPFRGKELEANLNQVYSFIDWIVAQHLEKLDDDKEDPEKTDFIYSYLRQMQKVKALGDEDSTLNGRRVCLGESMARMELFLYLATLIQHFRFLPPEEGQLPSLEGVFGLTQSPQPYNIRAVPRM
ncbi:hypothetical protein ACOMHN_039160 [Nucella lapillus]